MKFKDVMTVDEAVAIATKHPFTTAATIIKLQNEIEMWNGTYDGLQQQLKSYANYNAELASIFSKESADLRKKIADLEQERDRLLTENGEMKEELERKDDVNRANEAVRHQAALIEGYRKHLHDLNNAVQATGWAVTYNSDGVIIKIERK